MGKEERGNRGKGDKIVEQFVGKHSLTLPASQTLIFDRTLEDEEEELCEQLFPEAPVVGPSRRARLAKLADPTPLHTKAKPRNRADEPKSNISALEVLLPPPGEQELSRANQLPPKDWHEIAERQLSPEEERDARIIENRQHIDPKRFYKSSGTGRARGELPKRVHFGTVVVGAHEFYSSRMTKKERRSRIIDEVLADKKAVAYARNRSKRINAAKSIGKRVVDPAARKKRKNIKF